MLLAWVLGREHLKLQYSSGRFKVSRETYSLILITIYKLSR